MSGSDDEFGQYWNALNDLIESFPMDSWISHGCLDYLYLPRSIHGVIWRSRIHGWRSNLVLSTFTVSTETSPSPNPYRLLHSFDPFVMPPSSTTYVVPTFSGFWHRFGIHMSAESYSGVTLHPVPPNHNK